MPKPKVAFIPAGVSGVMFYRALQPVLALRQCGYEVALLWYKHNITYGHPWEADLMNPDKAAHIIDDVEKACDWADVVVWMGFHTPQALNLFQRMKAQFGKVFITEQDDIVFSIPAHHGAFASWLPGSDITNIGYQQIKQSDAMIVSTPYLKSLYEPYINAVHVVENAIDLSLWRGRPSSNRQRVTLGWVGGASHTADLEIVKDVVFELLDKYENVRFSCLHGVPDFFKHDKRINWTTEFASIDKYPAWVRSYKFDVGIAPLLDNTFNRGKSNLRWLEMSALGIPTVASPEPHFLSSITEGETGFIARDHNEWVKILSSLIESKSLRERVGRKALSTVKKKWNLKKMGRDYKMVIEEILNAVTNTGNFNYKNRQADRRPQQHPVL